MIEGRVTGVRDGVITGWVVADGGEDSYLEAVAEGGAPFGRTRAELGEDGRLHFAIPIPAEYFDGAARFFDVRPFGLARPLEGGPVIFDGGLFGPADAAEHASRPATAEPPPVIEGLARFEPPNRVEGWAWSPLEPSRRLRIELLAGGEVVAGFTADRLRPELAAAGVGDARYGFSVDLSKLLRRGPHHVTIRAAGAADPLPGGSFRTGVFAADGELECPGYLDRDEDRRRLARLPFEHQAFDAQRMDPARLAVRLINRLRRERMGLAAAQELATLVLLPGDPGPAAEVWTLQSYPVTSTLAAEAGPAGIRAAAAEARWLFFARPEDLIHPSAAAVAARLEAADAVSWGRFCADAPRAGAFGQALRRPPVDPVTARHGALTDTTLAIAGAVLTQAPDDVLRALAEGRLHPLWFWLAGLGLSWRAHPEALTSAVGPPRPLSRSEVERDEAIYRRLLAEEASPFTLERTAETLPFPYVLAPRVRAGKISVLVPFRNRAELTLRCVHALSRQRLSGELELVLVDNQSDPEEAARTIDGARRMLGGSRVVSLSYDAPFNHSAENNLAARAASGEVIVICNNDVALQEPTLLEQIAAWALQPGIGAVGCRLENPEREQGSYGHVLAPSADDPFQPPLRENPDPAYGAQVHACPGNPLALAAMRRDLYLELGGLDEVRFPIGYNDIDFMLRASARGLTHLYLGHLFAEHRRGASRTGDDEDLQALWINQAYPAAGIGRLTQLARVRIGPEITSAPAAAIEAETAPEGALVRALQDQVAAHGAAELKRAELAGALTQAEALVLRLQQALGKG